MKASKASGRRVLNASESILKSAGSDVRGSSAGPIGKVSSDPTSETLGWYILPMPANAAPAAADGIETLRSKDVCGAACCPVSICMKLELGRFLVSKGLAMSSEPVNSCSGTDICANDRGLL